MLTFFAIGLLAVQAIGDQSTRLLHVRAYDGSARCVYTDDLAMAADGYWVLNGWKAERNGTRFAPQSGPWVFLIAAPGYLASRVDVASMPAWNSIGQDVTLTPGDCTGDNAVGLDDLACVLGEWDAQPPPDKWGWCADINGDGNVGLTDLSIILGNFGMVGDAPPTLGPKPRIAVNVTTHSGHIPWNPPAALNARLLVLARQAAADIKAARAAGRGDAWCRARALALVTSFGAELPAGTMRRELAVRAVGVRP